VNGRLAFLPRSSLFLLLAIAAAALWLYRGRGGPPAAQRQVRLFPVAVDSVRELRWQTPERSVVLRRAGARWSLSGDVDDVVDPRETADLLAELTGLTAEIIPDALADTVVFGFRPFSPRLELVDLAGRRWRLRLGQQNQATGRVYGLRDGVPAVLALPGDLVGLVGALPDRVRARELWPGFAWQAVETLAIRPPGRAAWDLFVQRDGRWWYRVRGDAAARVPDWYRRHQRWYDDRRLTGTDGTWWLAAGDAVDELLVELATARVKELVPAGAAAETLAVVRVADRYGSQRHRLDLCPPTVAGRADAWRDGSADAVHVIGALSRLVARPLIDMLATSVVTWSVVRADSLRCVWVGRDSFRAVRRDGGWEVPGAPDGGGHPTPGETVHDLALHMERLAIRDVSPPGEAPRDWSPLFRITIWRSLPGAPAREVLLVGGEGLPPRPAAWSPALRRRCGIDRSLLTTLTAIFASSWLRH